MQTEVLTMALVGCGNIARAHWRGIRNHAPRIKVTAVVDSNPDNAASMSERTGAAAYSSLSEALVRGSFDAVDLMLPHDLHEEAAIKAFRAGKHVLLEKPMAPDLAGCERIMKAAKEADTVFMIAEQAQYWPDIKRARELIEDGQIGQVVTARACFYDPLPLNSTKDDGVPWRFIMRSHPAKSGAIGFSNNTCFPARNALIAASSCRSCGSIRSTASKDPRTSASLSEE
jgi:predicted dehydrogenase